MAPAAALGREWARKGRNFYRLWLGAGSGPDQLRALAMACACAEEMERVEFAIRASTLGAAGEKPAWDRILEVRGCLPRGLQP